MDLWNYIYIGAGFLGSLVSIGLAVKGCIGWIKDRKKDPSHTPKVEDGSNRDHEVIVSLDFEGKVSSVQLKLITKDK